MRQTTITDDLLMSLLEEVLAQPRGEREAFLRKACGPNLELFRQAWSYIEADDRMDGFLLEPVCPVIEKPHPFQAGQLLLGRFRILREVDGGGMGIVWEAMDEKLGLPVAIKAAKSGFSKQLPPEVRLARDITHTNVCKIHEIHTVPNAEGDIDFISMEFLEGATLSARLRSGPLPKKACLNIALQLCAGLAEAHRHGVIHGDFKSQNIMLTASANASGSKVVARAVIMDFGLAYRAGSMGAGADDLGLAGTPAYMAPELWKGVKPSVTSDIYALGVVFWEMISGRRAGDLGSAAPTLPWPERAAWKPPTGYGKWDRIIASCLDANPAARFQSAEEVARALGPSQTKIWLLRGSLAALLALVGAGTAYEIATRPAEHVRLALLPFSADGGSPRIPATLMRDIAWQLAHLKGTKQIAFTFIAEDKIERQHVDTPQKARALFGANRVLRGHLDQQGNAITVRVYLTDADTGLDAKQWSAVYQPAELRYAPVALAGFVTNALHLPVSGTTTVNAAAGADYAAGLLGVRQDSSASAALAAFERSVTKDPDSPLSWAGLAEAQWFEYIITNDEKWVDRVGESIRQAAIRNPDVAQVHCITGLLLANSGRHEQAISEYLRAIELKGSYGDAYRRLGAAYENSNQPDDALAAFRRAVDVDPQQYRNHRDLGYFYYQRGNYEEALPHFQTAARLARAEPRVHYYLGVVLLNQGRLADAEKEIRLSTHLRETAVALHELGLVFLYKGQERKAIPAFKRALQLGPEQSLWWMNLGTAYRRVRCAAEARKAYSTGLKLAEIKMAKDPGIGSERAHLAYLCAQVGDKGRAASDIKQALRQSPNDSDTLYMAAITYEALGRRNDAISVLAAAPPGVIADVSRWPDVADLRHDSRFIQLLASHQEK